MPINQGLRKYQENKIITMFDLKKRACPILWFSLLFFVPLFALAEIKFKEVSQTAGMSYEGPTYGASWGDFNGDGWPDLWVGNHINKPTLYLNQQDGTFLNIIDQVWSADPHADTHGAAWADFDNDGDQDLIEVVGGIVKAGDGICLGCAPSHLFVNENGKLINKAQELGLTVDATAIVPLWLDADGDGRLDVLVMNFRTAGRPRSTLFRQTANGFEPDNETFGFTDSNWGRREKVYYLIQNLLHFRFQRPIRMSGSGFREYAQLGDLSGNGKLDLISYSHPVRIYAVDTIPFREITNELRIPERGVVGDVAIEDFDGDVKFDVYATRGPFSPSVVRRINAQKIKGTIKVSKNKQDPRAVQFQTEGDVTFQLHPWWVPLSSIFIGASGWHPGSYTFTLSPNDPGIVGAMSLAEEKKPAGVLIHYDYQSKIWSLRNAGNEFIDFIISATKPIRQVTTTHILPFEEKGVDRLMLKRADRFVFQKLTGEAGGDTSCQSVVAGDFDNDMDVDIYLVCTGPVDNLPNRLLENDGKGNFVVVPAAGGASGSKRGRGDVAIIADYDRDGFLDLFVTNGGDPVSPFAEKGPHQLFRNQGNENHWLEIDLVGKKSNREGIGAVVFLDAGGITQVRAQTGGMHRFSQSHQRIHFGLGRYQKVDRLTIHWPSGSVQQMADIPSNQILRVEEKIK